MKKNGNSRFNEKSIKAEKEKLTEVRKEEEQKAKKIQHNEKLF